MSTDIQTELLNARVVMGLVAQGHIPTIEAMLLEGATWEQIGRRIGWTAETAERHYGWYLKDRVITEGFQANQSCEGRGATGPS